MLYHYPAGTHALVVDEYAAPYPDPISVREGDVVLPDAERTQETDFIGWTWCRGPDGREGWVPNSWIRYGPDGWTMTRDFSAAELSVRKGERVGIEFSESGFVFARTSDGRVGWLPDAVLRLA